jgi:hypothetical protein
MTTARKELTDKIREYMGLNDFTTVLSLLDRTISEGRFVSGEDAPYIDYISIPIRCGTKSILLQRRSGGMVQWVLTDELDRSVYRISVMTEKEQFDSLWILLMGNLTRPTDGKPEKAEP